jgi:uncharacterized membrane protein YfcA
LTKHPKRACIAAEVMGIIGYVLNPITILSTLQIVLFSAGFWVIYKCITRGTMHFAESVELCIISLIFFILGGFTHNPAEAIGSLLILGLFAMLAVYLRRQGTKNKH